MLDRDNEKLDEISKKMDLIINLIKLTNQTVLNEVRKRIESDDVLALILEYADGSRSYSEIIREVASETGKSKITVKLRIRELKELGVLLTKRKGKETFYEVSRII